VYTDGPLVFWGMSFILFYEVVTRMANVKIKTLEHGPLLVEGPIELVDAGDQPIETPDKPMIALCRCGASSSKPFCDGSHKNVSFD